MEEFPFMQRAQSLFRFDLMTETLCAPPALLRPLPRPLSMRPGSFDRHQITPSLLLQRESISPSVTCSCHSRRSGNPEPWLCADTVMATNTRRVDGGVAPCAFPSAQPSLHTTRDLDSRCDENDGVGVPDSPCGSHNGYQVTSSYLPLHGPERGHRNADNEKALVAPSVRLPAGCPSATLGPCQNGGETAHCLIIAGSLLLFLPPVSLTNFSHRLESAWCGF